jgi:raffinose/stachyose/melibiose transport system substrate-binding protein
MYRKVFFGLMTVLVVLSMLAGCAPQPAQTVIETVVIEKKVEVPVIQTVEVQKEVEKLITPTPEQINLEIWWWGGQNVPDYEDYLKRSIAEYEKLHPNIKITEVLRGTDDVIPAFNGAVEAGKGPDVATLWWGMYFMPDVWKGNALPLDQYVSQDEINHWLAADWHAWGNHYWQFDQWMEGHPIVYNKEMFTQAGLDPEKPPTTWDEILAACDALKAAGIEPMVIGIKDGWIATVSQDVFGFQELPNGRMDYMEAVLGIRKFTDPEFAYFDKMYELKERGCFNDDASSLGIYDGRMAYPAGRGAMNFPSLPTAMGWIKEMGSDKVGFMAPPMTSHPVGMAVDMEGLFLPNFSEHPQEASDFLAYLHSEDRMKAIADELGYVYVPDDRFNMDWIQDPVIKSGLELGVQGMEQGTRMVESLIPYSIFSDGFFPALQLMFSEDMKPAEAAAMVEKAAENWRQLNPEQVAQYRLWYEETKAKAAEGQ